MFQTVVFVYALVAFAAGGAMSPQEASVWGTWKGTWEQAGGGGGGLTLVLERTKDGTAGGRISVTGGPVYEAKLKSVTLTGSELTARYDSPDEADIEIVLTGTVEGKTLAGSWTARAKSGGEEVGGGTWKAATE